MKAENYLKTRNATLQICALLETEDFIPQAVSFISPPKWHLAHTTWFFEEFILKKFDPTYQEFNPAFSFLFNSYYNTVGKRVQQSERGAMGRPTVKEVYAYRAYVDEAISKCLSNTPNTAIVELVTLGINHEQQHQELLLTDLKYSFAQNPTFPIYDLKNRFADEANRSGGFVEMPEGIYEMGYEGADFHFDNEEGKHKVYLQSYTISKSLVTNQEYIDFIEAGGYDEFSYWLDDAWQWLKETTNSCPLYWQKRAGEWWYFTLAGLQKVNPNALLTHINFYEANAFANWKGMRLPTEFEWEAASDKFNWGQRWEWTNSAYLAYPNFKTKKGAVGEYNGKFMINQMVLRGASVATSIEHSRKTYRNFFYPFQQWQFTGIRLVK